MSNSTQCLSRAFKMVILDVLDDYKNDLSSEIEQMEEIGKEEEETWKHPIIV